MEVYFLFGAASLNAAFSTCGWFFSATQPEPGNTFPELKDEKINLMRKLLVSLSLLSLAAAIPAMADVVYSSLPSPIPGNVPSLGFECCQTSEFGQGVQLQGNAATTLSSATVLMSNWALESTYETVGSSTGYIVPLTLNLYNVGAGNAVGSLITTDTIDATIKWRPESGGCTDPTAYLSTDGGCYHGLAQTVTFNLSNVAVPGQFIWGLAFNTTDYGAAPTGVLGPYDSLNVGLNSAAPSTGNDLVANSAYWNTSTASQYGDHGAGGVGTFRLDSGNWTGQDPAIQFDSALPEPSFFSLIGLFGAGFGLARYKLKKKTA